MFIVSEFEEVVKVQPSHLEDDQVSRIVIHLNSILANKVVMDVGLCITLFDILEIDDSIIYPGEGAYFSKVRFRFVVFRYVVCVKSAALNFYQTQLLLYVIFPVLQTVCRGNNYWKS